MARNFENEISTARNTRDGTAELWMKEWAECLAARSLDPADPERLEREARFDALREEVRAVAMQAAERQRLALAVERHERDRLWREAMDRESAQDAADADAKALAEYEAKAREEAARVAAQREAALRVEHQRQQFVLTRRVAKAIPAKETSKPVTTKPKRAMTSEGRRELADSTWRAYHRPAAGGRVVRATDVRRKKQPRLRVFDERPAPEPDYVLPFSPAREVRCHDEWSGEPCLADVMDVVACASGGADSFMRFLDPVANRMASVYAAHRTLGAS